jgi:hypothetical protein
VMVAQNSKFISNCFGMRNERESKCGLPLGIQRVTLGGPVTLGDCDPACITQTASHLKMGPIGCPETSANYQRTLRFIRPKDWLRCSGSPKYRTFSTLHGTKFQCDNAASEDSCCTTSKRISKFDSSRRAPLNANGLWFPATIGSRV